MQFNAFYILTFELPPLSIREDRYGIHANTSANYLTWHGKMNASYLKTRILHQNDWLSVGRTAI